MPFRARESLERQDEPQACIAECRPPCPYHPKSESVDSQEAEERPDDSYAYYHGYGNVDFLAFYWRK